MWNIPYPLEYITAFPIDNILYYVNKEKIEISTT
jgi:hypothetical protein